MIKDIHKLKYNPWFLKNFILILLFTISSSSVQAKTIELDTNNSKLIYTLTQFNIPFKRKALPTTGIALIEENKSSSGNNSELTLLQGLDTQTRFTSKNPFFRKVIDYDHYPFLTFSSRLENLIDLNKSNLISISGDLTFHGVTRKTEVNLETKHEKDYILLTGAIIIKMSDFGITPPRFLFLRVDDKIKTKIELAIYRRLCINK